MNVHFAFHNYASIHIHQFAGLFGGERVMMERLGVIEFVGIWTLWKRRNEKILKRQSQWIYGLKISN